MTATAATDCLVFFAYLIVGCVAGMHLLLDTTGQSDRHDRMEMLP